MLSISASRCRAVDHVCGWRHFGTIEDYGGEDFWPRRICAGAVAGVGKKIDKIITVSEKGKRSSEGKACARLQKGQCSFG
ncbi:MAG: hypothetical protein KatS3mg077_0663 [Candidatus Binatia bacterium]|nr:MAG: hypothetical protein KatS3mg077_0663 [Candidatus Binatia bacterium]